MISPDSVGRTYNGAKSTTISQSEITNFAAVFGESDFSVATPTFSIRTFPRPITRNSHWPRSWH
jgi:hypothetical protein